MNAVYSTSKIPRLSPPPTFQVTGVPRSTFLFKMHSIWTRSSAVAERPRDASCHSIFREVTQCHSILLKIVPFDSCSHTCSYRRSIVIIYLLLRHKAAKQNQSINKKHNKTIQYSTLKSTHRENSYSSTDAANEFHKLWPHLVSFPR